MTDKRILYLVFTVFLSLALGAAIMLYNASRGTDQALPPSVLSLYGSTPTSTLSPTTTAPATTTTIPPTTSTTNPFALTILTVAPPSIYPPAATITGTAIPEVLVTVSHDSASVETVADLDGAFLATIPLTDAPTGPVTVTVVVPETGEFSTVTVLNEMPLLTIDPLPETIREPLVEITGLATPLADVTIDSPYGFSTVVALPTGRFSATLSLADPPVSRKIIISISSSDEEQQLVSTTYQP